VFFSKRAFNALSSFPRCSGDNAFFVSIIVLPHDW